MRFIVASSLFQHMFCNCTTKMGGPAGDYMHHESKCRVTRFGRRLGIANNDPATNWWTMTKEAHSG